MAQQDGDEAHLSLRRPVHPKVSFKLPFWAPPKNHARTSPVQEAGPSQQPERGERQSTPSRRRKADIELAASSLLAALGSFPLRQTPLCHWTAPLQNAFRDVESHCRRLLRAAEQQPQRLFSQLRALRPLRLLGDATRRPPSASWHAAPALACLSLARGSPAVGPEEPRGGKELFQLAMSTEQVARRLDGVPVYTISNASNEFVLVTDFNGGKSLGILCFRPDDAEALLAQVKEREPSLGRGSRVVAVTLDKVLKLRAEGIAFRFLPDPAQVKNAIETRASAGRPSRGFEGVPVFQSDNLILRSKERRFCPIFFRKEDLESALRHALAQKKSSNPSMLVSTSVQVGSFEDVLKKLKESEEDTGWGDIVFIPPGMDVFGHMDKAVGGKTVVA